MTEYKRLEKLAKENNWPMPKGLESIVPYFKLWRELEEKMKKEKEQA